MGIVARQSIKNSIVVLSGAVLGAVVTFLSTKLIADKQHFGFIQTLTRWAVTLSQILILGMGSTLFVYIHRFKDNEEKKRLLVTFAMIVPFVGCTLFSLVYLLSKPFVLSHFQPQDIALMNQYYIWLPLYILFFIYINILELYLGSQMKIAASAFVREIVVRLLNLTLLFLYGTEKIGFSALLIGTVLIYLVPVVSFLRMSVKTEHFRFGFKLSYFSRADYKEVFNFAIYHFLLNVAIILLVSMDSILLPFYDANGFRDTAIYTVALFLLSFLQIPFKALMQASLTVMTEAITANDLVEANHIFVRSSLNILIPTVLVGILLSCNVHNIVEVIGNGKNYANITEVFLILFIGRMIDTSTGMNDQVLSITDNYRFTFFISIVVSLLLFFSIRTFVPTYQLIGAAWCSTGTYLVFNVAKFWFVWKKLGMQPFSKNTVIVIVCAIPAVLAGYLLPDFFHYGRHMYWSTFYDLTLRSSLIVAVYGLMLIWLKPSPDLEKLLSNITKNKRLF